MAVPMGVSPDRRSISALVITRGITVIGMVDMSIITITAKIW